MPKISIIIVSYNSARHLDRCLDAVAAQDHADFETIVLDNGSVDDSARIAAERASPYLRAVSLGRNLGFAGANNAGAAMAQGSWLATLNPDAFPRRNWLSALVAATERHPEAAMFGSTQIDAGDPRRLDGCGDCYHVIGIMWRGGHGASIDALPGEGDVFSPCAAAALWRRDAFLAAGGFDERFFCYCEDVDLAFRLRAAGHRCIQVPGAVVDHVGGGSSEAGGDFELYHGTRNRIWVYAKNMPWALLLAMAPAHAVAEAILLGMAAKRGHAGAAWRGLRDGLAGLPIMLAASGRQSWVPAGAMTWRLGPLLRRGADIRAARQPVG
jgi:N-acetylglucosaminyl-diphospho-decaprenol L-rhamnosyltransferase